MAEPDASRHMSLIPYASQHGEIVLRHGDAIVTYDGQSRQLMLRDSRTEPTDQNACPYCQRPFGDQQDSFDSRQSRRTRERQHGFVNPEYFRMLADRTPVSARTTRASSPSTPLRALRSGESRNVRRSGPPTGAEFVGSNPAPRNPDQGIKKTSFLPGYFHQFFVEKRVLGRGGRGVVLLVEHILDGVNCGDFACKRIPVGNDHDWLSKVLVEVQLLQRLHHPNLVAYQHVWLEDAQTTKFGPSVPCVFILQQFCNSGDLHEYVQKALGEGSQNRRKERKASLATLITLAQDKRQMPLDEIFSFFKDIVSGLDHLHKHGYIHRDLKPSNCLLHTDGECMTVHVSDFGEVQAATAQRASTGATGTISYCAPEVLQKENSDGAYGNFTTKSDVFSLGMILHYMCFGSLPYINADIKEENEDIDLLRSEIISWRGFDGPAKKRIGLPDQLFKFLEQLLNLDPVQRPSTTEILYSLRHGVEFGTQKTVNRRVEILEDATSSADEQKAQHYTDRHAMQLRRRASHGQPSDKPRRPRFHAEEVSNSSSGGRPARETSASTHNSPDLQSGQTSAFSEYLRLRHDEDRRHHSDTDVSDRFNGEKLGNPQLLLTAPPPSNAAIALIAQVRLDAAVRAFIFAVKAFILMQACSPFTTRFWTQSFLLGLAAVDLLIPYASLRWSAILLLAWTGMVLLLSSTEYLCSAPGPLAKWEDVRLKDAG